MDYHSMKRRELQALCKRHDIPANSANSVLADQLSELLNGKQKPRAQQRTCMKSPAETIDESEPAVSRRGAKKVRFSNDLVEQKLRSGTKEQAKATDTKGRRRSMAKKVDKPVDDSDNTVELDDAVEIPVKVTRSRAQVLEKDNVLPINEKKQSRRAVKNVEKGTDAVKETEGNTGKVTRSKANKLEKGGGVQAEENQRNKRAVKEVEKASESVEENVVGRVRVTRSKAQTSTEDGNKKSGRRVAKDVETVEPSKEIIDIPVRVTRSRRETINDGSGKTVAKPQAEKKRTRRDTQVVSEDNNELPKRKLPRTKGVDIADEGEKPRRGRPKKSSEETIAEVSESRHNADVASRQSRRIKSKVEDSKNGSKAEMVNDTKVTRSKATNSRSKGAEKVEEPSKKAGKNIATRRKSVVQPKITKSPKVGTRRTVGRKKAKGQTGNLSVADEGLKDKDSEMKAVASASGSQKSRKRRGDPIIETEYVSPVVESPKRSTRSGGKSEVKSVAKKQESSSKTSASRTNINSSKKKAKLSEKKQSDPEDHNEKSNTKGTPVSKMVSFEVNEKATGTEHTPAVDESGRRFTRSAIKENAVGSSVRKVVRKKSSQSAIKEQAIGNVESSSHKAPKFRPDPVMNTAPGRITRSGIRKSPKSVKISPKSVKKSVRTDTKGVRSEAFKEVEDQITELAASDSVSLTTKLVEENGIPTSEAAIVMENLNASREESLEKEVTESASAHIEKISIETTPNVANNETSELNNLFSEKKLSPVDSPKFDDETPSEKVISDDKKTPFATTEVAETAIDEFYDGSHAQNQNPEVVVDLEKSVVESPRAEVHEKETELTKSGSTSKGNDGEADNNLDAGVSPVIHATFEQSDVKTGGVGKEVTEGSKYEMSATPYMIDSLFGEKQQSPVPNFEDESETESPSGMDADLSTAEIIETGINAFLDGSPSPVQVQNQDVDLNSEKSESETEKQTVDVKGNSGDEAGSSAACHVSLEQSAVKMAGKSKEVEGPLETSILEGVKEVISDDGGEIDIEKEVVPEKDGLTSVEGAYNDESDDEDKTTNVDEQLMNDETVSDDNNVIDTQEIDSEIGKEPSRDDHNQEEILTATAAAADDDDGEKQVVEEPVSEDDNIITTQEMDTEIAEYDVEANTQEIPIADDDDDDKLQGLPMDENDDIVTEEAAKEVESDVVPSTVNDDHESPIFSKSEGDTDPILTAGGNVLEDSVLSVGNANKDEVSDTIFGKDDDDQTQPIPDQTTATEVLHTSFSDKDDDVENDGDTEPLVANDTFESPLFGNDADNDCVVEETDDGGSGQEQLTTNHSPAMDQHDFGDGEPEQQPEPVMNIAVEQVSSDTVIGPSDSSTTKPMPQSPAVTGNDATLTQVDLDDSIPDINQDTLPNDFDLFGNTAGVTDTENDGANEHTSVGTSQVDEGVHSKESESDPLDMSDEQETEEAELATHVLGDQKEQIIAAAHDDLDADSIMDDSSNHGVDEFAGSIQPHHNPTTQETSPIKEDHQMLGDTEEAHESPITEDLMPITYNRQESPADDTVSDPHTSFKSNDTSKQEETQNAPTPEELWNITFGVDQTDKSTKDDRVSDVQTCTKLRFSIDESSSSHTIDLEKTFRDMDDGKSNQPVNMDFLNWPDADSSLKALLTTPAATQTSRVKNRGQSDFSFGIDFDAVIESIKTAPQLSRVFNEETQDDAPKNKSFGVPNFEDFDDEEADGMKVDQMSQDDLFGDVAGSSHRHDACDLKKEETGDDEAVDKGKREM